MRYVFISDIHGCCDKMIAALDQVNFNPEVDTLVSVGDPFDRGPDSYGVLEYIMNCPHKIIVWGNHDARLKKLIYNQVEPEIYDYYNGVLETFMSFVNDKNLACITDGISYLINRSEYAPVKNSLIEYFNEAVYAVEWSDLIVTHGWLPISYGELKMNKKGKYIKPMKLNKEWHTASKADFYEATWANTEKCIKNNMFPDKKLLVGHWHAHLIHMLYDTTLTDETAPYTTFSNDKLIAIDGCSNAPEGVVNAWVYESAEEPVTYKGE